MPHESHESGPSREQGDPGLAGLLDAVLGSGAAGIPLTAMDLLPAGVIVVAGAREPRILYANAAFQEIVGCRAEPGALGSSLGCQYYPPDREAPLRPGQLLAGPAIDRGETVRNAEIHVRRPDGTWRVVVAAATPVRTDSAVAAVAVFQDITRQKEAEDRLHHAASFPERNPNPVVETDLDGSVTYANPAALTLFPDLPAAGTAHPFLQGITQVAAHFQGGGCADAERDVCCGRAVFRQRIHYVPDRRALHLYSVDVTERRRAEDALCAANERLEIQAAALNAANEQLEDQAADLQSANEELQAANEELQSQSEELQVANEELQSQSEELQAANDELQSQSEELQAQTEELVAQARELERTNDDLRQSEHRLRAFVDNAAPIAWVKDLDGRFTLVNRTLERALGRPAEEILGRTVFDFFPRDVAEGYTADDRQVIATGKAIEFEEVTPQAGGSQTTVAMKFPLCDAAGRVTAVGALCTDITERKQVELEREMTVAFLRLVNESTTARDLVEAAARFAQQHSGCEAVGIRLQEGDDFPYFEARGFPQEFVEAENSLCTRDAFGEPRRDTFGNPVLDCMCGNVLQGRYDASKPFFSPGGSFWTNCTTDLLASTTEADRLVRTRNRCNGEGYQSVALVPLRMGEQHLGLLQLNDRQPGRFTPERIALWERLAGHLAVALAKVHAEDALRQSESRYRSLFENMLNGYAHCRMLFDGDEPRDFIYLDVNRAFGELTGLRDVAGKRVTEVIPGIRESNPELFDVYGRVARSGIPEHLDTYVDQLGVWFSLSVYSPRREHFVAVFENVTERKQAEEALRDTEMQHRIALDAADLGTWRHDPASDTVHLDARAREHFGFGDGRVPMAQILARVHPDDLAELTHQIGSLLGPPAGSGRLFAQARFVHPDGGVRWLAVRASAVFDGEGAARRPAMVIGTSRDISERKLLEEELRQAQKMEAVGRLAGGVAHDFNNLLTPIMAYGQMLCDALEPGGDLHRWAVEIATAAERAAGLPRQLLAFSRKQIIQPRVLDLNGTITGIEKMLQRLIGEDIILRAVPARALGKVMADPGQIEQVIVNMAVNARDAMPHGGRLAIETANVELDDAYTRRVPGLEPGRYVMLAVTDTGCGIKKTMLSRIFEPFFTTKEVGKGTGLGLSTVYGIVKQNGGEIRVYSELGHGTTFRIYLPRVDAPVDTAEAEDAARPASGTETVLLVEDEDGVREAMQEILQAGGYVVLSAGSGEEALVSALGHYGPIHLLLTDVVMPGMSGRLLAEQVAAARSETRVLFMSGYTEDAIVHHGVLEEGIAFLQKPFAPGALLRKVREVLECPPGPTRG